MKSLRLLLQTLVRFWDIREEDFIIQEQRIEVTLLDMYFFDSDLDVGSRWKLGACTIQWGDAGGLV